MALSPHSTLLSLLCWITRRYQKFPRRWQLVGWLESHRSQLSNLPPGPRSVGRLQSLFIDPSDFDGLRYLINGLNLREPIGNVMSQLLREGDCVLDVGANVGYFTALASRLVGRKGRVIAYEASPETFERLKHTANNKYQNVLAEFLAVSDRCGTVEFSCSTDNHSGKSSVRELDPKKSARVLVPCATIDSFLSRLPAVRLMKIDVEGAELLVLKGAVSLIERDNPIIILELTDEFLRELGGTAEEVLKLMTEKGYSAYRLGRQPIPLEGNLEKVQLDVLFLPRTPR